MYVLIDLVDSLSRDGTNTACASTYNCKSLSPNMFTEYLVYRRGETPGGKRKNKGSGRGAFKVISKLYLGS